MSKKTGIFSCFLGLLTLAFWPEQALAFTVEMSDKSRQYLGVIFGGSVGPIILSDEKNVVIGRLFAQLNTIAFVLGTIMVGYITVVSTLNTAKEGRTMGQKWSSIWIPLRSVLGLLVMVPTPVSGYSTIQVTVIWFVLQGIGAANSVWYQALDALAQGLSVTASTGFSSNQGQTDGSYLDSQIQENQLKKVMQGSFQAAVCARYMNHFADMHRNDNLKMPNYNEENTGGGSAGMYIDPVDPARINIGFENGLENANGLNFRQLCGTAKVQCRNENGSEGDCLDTQKLNLIQSIIANTYQSMSNLVEPLFTEINRQTGPLNEDTQRSIAQQIKGAWSTNTGLYENQLSQMKAGILQMAYSDRDDVKEMVRQAKRLGWIHAGSYYMALNGYLSAKLYGADTKLLNDPNYGAINPKIEADTQAYFDSQNISFNEFNNILTNIHPNLSFSPDNPLYRMMALSGPLAKKPPNDDISQFFNQLLVVNDAVIPKAEQAREADELRASNISVGSLVRNTDRAKLGITPMHPIKTFQKWISSTNDPLGGISVFGAGLMITAEVMLSILFLTSVATSLALMLNCPVSFSQFVNVLVVQGFLTVGTSAILLWVTGAIFAVYMPMIPYLIFTATAVGWMFAVIEALVAAPILALGFVSPSGDELGKAGQGLLMLTGLFLKPTLMIFGFILASRLLKAVLTFINNMFALTIEANIAGVSVLFGWVAPMFLYAAFVIAMTNKCFSLIYILPDKIMRWIGVQPDGFSVEDVMQKTEQKRDEGLGATQGVMKGIQESRVQALSKKK